jgi:hypothetical protein
VLNDRHFGEFSLQVGNQPSSQGLNVRPLEYFIGGNWAKGI